MNFDPRLGSLVATALPSGFAMALLCVRVQRTHTMTFTFLAWNLVLAWIAYALGESTIALGRRRRSGAALCIGAWWWLFFPNTLYLTTDLLHLRYARGAPFWFDLGLLLAFAASGVALALASLHQVRSYVAERWGSGVGWAFFTVAALSSGFGIWLGRVRRYNSWDVVMAPEALVRDVAGAILAPGRHVAAWGVTLIFAGLLVVLYFAYVGVPRAWITGVSGGGGEPLERT